jgi:ferredoxin-NADP reductase
MVKDLKDSVKGMENLKETYMNDIMFCCKLDTLIEEIKARLSEMNKLDNKVIHEERFEEKKEEIKKEEVKKEKNK